MPVACRAFSLKSHVSFLLVIILFLAFGKITKAQTCTGSLGDPIINTTFGSGTGAGSPLNTSVTTLNYSAVCPGDNSYAIVNNTSTCNADWHNVTQDHTGDADGRFMLINAASTPGDLYVQQVDRLCSGNTYQLSTWILNMAKTTGVNPNITFNITQTDGNPIASFDTHDIPKTAIPTWQPFTYSFSLPNGASSIIIHIHNNAPGGTGTALALDDITLKAMGPPITLSIQGASGNSITVCQNSPPIVVSANVGACYPYTTYEWEVYRTEMITPEWAYLSSDGGNQTYSIPTNSSGTFQYRLLVANNGNNYSPNCAVVSTPITITILPTQQPTVNVVPSKTNICTDQLVSFNASSADLGPGTPVYDWQINGVSVNVNSDHYSTSTLHNGDQVTCSIVSKPSCAPPGVSKPITMHVNGQAPVITVTPSLNNICAGTPVTFTVSANQTSGLSYQWQINGINAPAPSKNITFTNKYLKNNDVVTCLVTSSSCSVPVQSDGITMTVYDAPQVNITASATTICANTQVIFNADVIQGASYQWQINGNPVGNNNPVYIAPKVNNGDQVNCLVLANSMCSAPITTAPITMHVSSPPTSVTITASAAAICKGSPATFTATADQTTGINYQWLVNGQTVNGTTNTFTKTDLTNTDVVTCQVSSNDNCGPPVPSNALTVVVTDIPQITLTNSNYQIYKGESANIMASATGSNLTYKWSPATGLDKTDVAAPVASPTQTTQYTLTVTNAAGCSQISAPVTVNVTIRDIVPPNSFTPNNDGVNDKWEIAGLANDPTAQVQVFNRYGFRVFYSKGYLNAWDGSFKSKSLPSGVYYYTISANNNTRKISGFVTIIR